MGTSKHIENTLKLIASLLIREESCFLPGIGLLKAVYHPAKERDRVIHPPYTEIVIAEDNDKEAHQIIYEMKQQFGLSTEIANAMWQEVQKHVKEELEAGHTLPIPGLGHLRKDKDRPLIFIENSRSAFLPPIENPKEHFENPEYDVDPFPEEGKSYKKRKLLYALFILIGLIIVGSFIYLYLATDLIIQHPRNAANKVVTNAPGVDSPTARTSVKSDSLSRQKNTESTTLPASDSVHFVVVYRKSTSKEKAIKDYKQKTSWGYKVAIYTKDSHYFLVGYPYYSLPKDTTAKVKEKHDVYGVRTWAILPKKQGYHRISVPK